MSDNQRLSHLTDELVRVMQSSRDASEALLAAKESVPIEGEKSTRGMVQLLAGHNGYINDDPKAKEDDPDAVDTLAQDVILRLYGKPNKVRKAELKVLIETRSTLNQVLTGVDNILATMRKTDPHAQLNVTRNLLALSRGVRNESKKKTPRPVKELIDELKAKLTHHKTKTEAAIKKVDNIGKDAVFQVDVGDEKMLDPVASAALTMLRAVAVGKPFSLKDTPEFQEALREAIDEERALWEKEQAQLVDSVNTDDTPPGASSEPDTAVFASEVPDSPEGPEPAPEPAQPPEEAKPVAKKPLGQPMSVTGLGADDLLKQFGSKS